MSRQWTEEQLAAMETKGGGVLVSAAAGSGKTAVLVERIIRRITEGDEPVPADRLLVATFTNAAAAEMRERIDSRLRELLAAKPGDPFLEQQLVRLQKAKICTMDAYFAGLVRENFEQLGISPTLRIAEDSELSDLRAGAMDRVMEQSYEEASPDFLAAVSYFGEQSDDKLTDAVLMRSRKLRSLPRPKRWTEEQLAAMQPEGGAAETRWGKELLAAAERIFSIALRLNRRIADKLSWDEGLAKGYGGAIAADSALFSEGLRLARDKQWDALCHYLSQNKPGPIGRAPKGSNEALKAEVQALRDLCKDFWEEAGDCIPCTDAEFREDCVFLLPVMRGLFGLWERFEAEFFAARQEAGLADFSDMAAFALRLCTDGEGNPSDFGRTLSHNYEEILLDEYQDTNRLQDEIFRAVSRDGQNLFYVGDLKQSIYRFRSADPTVFAEKQASFAEDGSFPALLRLSRNFRSREGVLDAVNCVFSQIMSREAGGVDYTQKEAVHPGAVYPERQNPPLVVQLLNMQEETEDSRIAAEARETAARIASMLREGYPVTEDGTLRPCRPEDFAILLRSLQGVETIFYEALQQQGVDAQVGSAEGYFTSREVLAMVSLLQVLDNPLQDIPMAAVMLSPLGMFSCDELSALRLSHPEDRLYTALLAVREENAKAEKFLSLIAHLREKAAVRRVRSLIQYIYDATDFLEIMAGSGKSGVSAGREANLRLLLQYAGDYERSGRSELSGFVGYIRRLIDRGEDFQVANPLSASTGMVRIMSVHKSKGLEFPIVILANCAKSFNLADSNRPVVLHTALGCGMQVVDRQKLRRYPTLSWAAVRRKEREDTLSEELRLLYVAMTRARETLILNISLKNPEKKLWNLSALLDGQQPVDPGIVLGMNSWSDWLLAALLRHPDFAEVRRRFALETEVRDEPFALSAEWAGGEASPKEETETEVLAEANPVLTAQIARQCGWRYPWRERTVIPAKLAVTDIVRREEEAEGSIFLPLPAFTQEKGFSAAERGSIFHRALQFADYAAGRLDPAAELLRLEEARYLTHEEAQTIPLTAFSRFFRSELMERILASPRVLREYRFFDTVPASRAGYEGEDEILIQGVADCVFEEDGAGVLLDYKTDHTGASELLRRYSSQLSLYRRALAPLFPKGIRECLIYSVYEGKTVPVPEEK